MVMRDIRCSASMWMCLRTPRELRELITANCQDEAQQLELPCCYSKKPNTYSTHRHNPSCTPPTPWFLLGQKWAPSLHLTPHSSGSPSLGRARSIAQRPLRDDWELAGVDMSWPRLRLLRLLFSAVGFPPLLWYWWNPKDACSQMSLRQSERKMQLAAPHSLQHAWALFRLTKTL